MTQKTLAEQVAEMQNNLIALDKLLQAPVHQCAAQPLVGRIVVEYDDGTEQIFVPHKVTEPTKAVMSAEEVLKVLRKRKTEEPKVAEDPLPRKPRLPRIGFACIINGVKYNSIIHASRVLGMCRHTIKHNIDLGLVNWSYA